MRPTLAAGRRAASSRGSRTRLPQFVKKEIEMAMLYVFYQTHEVLLNEGQMFYQRFDGNSWYGIQHVAPSGQPVGMSCAPSPVVWNGGLLQVFHQGFRQDGQ